MATDHTRIHSQQELYRSFVEFVGNEVQGERHRVNRRMFNVFLWCFLIPAVIGAILLLLVRFGLFPRSIKRHLDWVLLLFPVVYSLYVLGSEVLTGIPVIFKRGGLASTLRQALEENAWRARVREGMENGFPLTSAEDWKFIVASFEMDLETLRHRTRYLTFLAGAVFYLIMQGIDSIGAGEERTTWVRNPIFGWMETSSDLSPYVGLVIFLVLLYLSGNQTYHSLRRYWNCAQLVLQSKLALDRDR